MGRADNLGRKTIYIRVSHQQERRYIITPFKVLPANFKKGSIQGSPQAKMINEELKRLIVKTEYEILSDRSMKAKKEPTFMEYAMEFVENQSKTLKKGTTRQNWTEMNKFSRFQEANIKLKDIDSPFLTRYQHYLIQLGNAPNSVWKSFKFLHKIILTSYLNGVIGKNPFIGFKYPKYTSPHRQHLTDAELSRIAAVAQNPKASPEVRFITNWFLIGCYTALRFSDWQQFDQEEHIHSGRLVLHTTKTGEIISMPLVKEVRNLLEAVGYKGMHHSNQYCNRVLKEVGYTAGIKKKLTAHISRHTFGVRAAHVMSLEACAKLMGITVKVCSVYYKIIDRVSDEEYKKLFTGIKE
jgi:site-specific recombinase XerD